MVSSIDMQQGSMEGVLSVSKESLKERDIQEEEQDVRVSKKCRRKTQSKHLRKFSKNKTDLQVRGVSEVHFTRGGNSNCHTSSLNGLLKIYINYC